VHFSENATRIFPAELGRAQVPPGTCFHVARAVADCGSPAVSWSRAAMSSLNFEERRQSPRHRLGRLATIKLGVGMEPRYVLVTNTSIEGVRLQLNGIDALDEFVLLFHGNGGAARDGTYKMVWRQGQDVGAKFLSPAIQCA
jgi:hypothetical protein